MQNKRLQSIVTAGRWTLPAVILICALCWVAAYMLWSDSATAAAAGGTNQSFRIGSYLQIPDWVEQAVSVLIYILTGYLLIELNNRFGIIRMRASMQTAIYLLLITVCPGMHLLYADDLIAPLLLISIHFLFTSYQQSQAAPHLFHSFCFIGTGSILFPPLTLLAPLWLAEAYRFRSLTPRSFCGALLGWILPYWFLLGHAFFYGQMELFYRPFRELVTFGDFFAFSLLQPWQMAVLGYLLVLFIVSTAHSIAAGFEDKIRTRAYLQFLINLTFVFFVLIVLQPVYCGTLLPLLILTSSFLIGHFFVLTNSKSSNIFFVCSLVGLLLLFAFNVWTLLSIQ